MKKRLFGIVALIILSAANLYAQSQHKNRSRGFNSNDVFSSHEIDHINLFNGNLLLNIPIGNTYPVGGNLSYSFNLVYNSYHWTQREVCVSGANLNTQYFTTWVRIDLRSGQPVVASIEPFNIDPSGSSRGPTDGCYTVQYPNPAANAGMGWQLNLGRLYLPQANPTAFHPQTTERSQIVYQAPDGSEHAFFATLHEGETGDPDKYFYSRDGSYLRLEKVSNSLYKIHFPNGVIHSFTPTITGPFPEDTEYRVTDMRDLFGNYVNINYTQTQWTVTDSVGRTHRINLSAQANNYQNVVTSIVLEAVGDSTATYELEYFNQSTVRAQPHAPMSEVPQQTDNVTLPYLTRVRLPGNAGGYSMPQAATLNANGAEVLPPAYDFTGESTSVLSTGMIRGIILPTGATVKWRYSGREVGPDQTEYGYVYPMVSSARNYLRFSVGVRERTLTLGTRTFTWKYDPVPERQASGCLPSSFSRECQGRLLTNTVTNPEGDYTKHYFSIYPYPGTNYNTRNLNDWHVAEYSLPINKYQTKTELLTGKSLFLSSEVYARGGVKKRSTYLRYEIDRYPQEDGFGSEREVNARVAAMHTTFHDDGDKYQQVSYSDFDGLGHYRIAQYVSNFGYGDQRIEITKYNVNSLPLTTGGYYNSGSYSIDPATNTLTPAGSFNLFPDRPWVLNTYSRKIAGDFDKRSTSFFRFNENGQLTGKRVRKDLEEKNTPYLYKPNDVLTIYEYYPDGNLKFEKFYGGDVQKGRGDGTYDENNQAPIFLASGSGEYTLFHTYRTCGSSQLGVLESSQYLGLAEAGYKIVDNVIDCSTGLVVRSRDTAENPTEYSYDALGRLTDIKPDAAAQTHIDYVDVPIGSIDGSPSVNVTHKDKVTGLEYDREEYRYDQLGRISIEKVQMPGNVYSARYTTYNGMGWVTSISEWLDHSLVQAGNEQEIGKKTTYSNFDPFGRPWRTTLPDNKVVQQQYSGIRQITRINTIRTQAAPATETSVERKERYDQFGRLFQVEEPSATSGAYITTNYTYNVINKLTQASTTSQAGITQLRTFVYDNIGNLTLETLPEKSGTAQYKDYDTLNNVGRTYDGQHWVVYSYDKGSRITKMEELIGGAPRALKDYTYYPNANCPTTVGTSWGLGKLCSARRHNWVTNPRSTSADEIDVVISEDYYYTGLDGRLGKRVTKTNSLNTTPGIFEQTFTYHPLGHLASQTYPQCTNANCANSTGNQARPWKVNYVYAKGVLRNLGGGSGTSTANNNYASSITYNANQTINSIVHANGVTDFRRMDPNNMPRVARMWAAKGAATLWDSEDYFYDGSGNITNIGTDWYLYDKVNRLVEGSAMRISNQRKQRYTYDAFGNQILIKTYEFSSPTGGIEYKSFNPHAISATNKIEGILYDGAGNVTGMAPNNVLYGYDALNMMKYAPGYTYLYGPTDERTWIADRQNISNVIETYILRGLNNEVLREYQTTFGDVVNSWKWKKDYIYAGDTLLASEAPGTNSIRHYHLDHLGTPRIITNYTGDNITDQQYQYFPFGDDVSLGEGGISSLSPADERLKFTGHEYSPDYAGQNLTYMHARFYKPGWGKFMSVDPGRDWDLKQPQSWNLYTYVRNNPVRHTDPTGREIPNKQPIPAPQNPDGTPQSPTEDVPPLPDGKSKKRGRDVKLVPNEWVPGEGSEDRPVRWIPKHSIPGQGQPNVSWDSEKGHWDHNDGKGNRTRWLPNKGGQVDHWNNPIGMYPRRSLWEVMRGVSPEPVAKAGAAAIITYFIISEGTRLIPIRNAIPIP